MIALRDAWPGDAAGMARVQVEGWRHAYSSFMPAGFIAARNLELRLQEWWGRLENPAPGVAHLVADEAGEVMGITSGGPPLGDETVVEGDASQYTAQVYGLYVAPDRLAQGIGRRLLGLLAQRLAAAGHGNIVLWAFAENPYRRFYDRLGGRQVARGIWNIDGISLVELAFAWDDIASLIDACLNQVKTQ